MLSQTFSNNLFVFLKKFTLHPNMPTYKWLLNFICLFNMDKITSLFLKHVILYSFSMCFFLIMFLYFWNRIYFHTFISFKMYIFYKINIWICVIINTKISGRIKKIYPENIFRYILRSYLFTECIRPTRRSERTPLLKPSLRII